MAVLVGGVIVAVAGAAAGRGAAGYWPVSMIDVAEGDSDDVPVVVVSNTGSIYYCTMEM